MMRVQVEVLCAPHPLAAIEGALRSAGKRLALAPDSVSVEVREGEGNRLTAVLEFQMRQAAQYKVVDNIYVTVKGCAWAFYEDITVRFPKD
jgi:hypothetical protein